MKTFSAPARHNVPRDTTFARTVNQILDFVLPTCCVLCGMSADSTCLCRPCRDDMPWTGIQCRTCGLPLSSNLDRVCGHCIRHPPQFYRTVSPLHYRFPADKLIQSFKFNRQVVAGRVLGRLLYEYVIHQGVALPGVLVPVPLHPLRMLGRGYNQAWELARHTGRALGIPVLGASLRRGRHTKAQSGLSRKQRRKNVRGAFFWHGPVAAGKHVAIIDDVMTTGTTLNECARTVRKAGAKRVDVWVAARAIPVRQR